MAAAAKSHDFEIRAAIVRELLAHGIPRRDIRHEITLDSHSSGGRADVVAVLSDTVVAGIEIKSASDNLARCVQQLDAYARAFDAPLFVVDDHLWRRLERPDRHAVRGSAVVVSDLWSAFEGQRGSAATVDGMARLLWGSEIEGLVGRKSDRRSGLDRIRQNVGLTELRASVVAALRNRVPNKWEVAFWARFDVEDSARERAA